MTATDARVRIAYILAASHSGSTLLAMLLGAHPEVCTVGELKAASLDDVERYRCSCAEEIRRCRFWNGVSEDMARRGFAFDVTRAGTDIRSVASPYARRLLRPLHRGPFLEWLRDLALALDPSWRAALGRAQQINAVLARCLLERTGKTVLVDSSKAGVRLKYLLRNAALDVQVIRLVRDGRGVALTYTDPARFADAQDPSLRGGGAGGTRDAERLTMAAAAREWRRSNEEAEEIVRQLPPTRVTEVRYEDLCSFPRETLRRLAAFLRVDPERVTLAFREAEQHVLGNGMRLDSTSEIRFDERWRSVLARTELDVFDFVAGEANQRLGYR